MLDLVKLLGLFLIAVGLFVLVLLPGVAWSAWRFRRHGVRTTGTVIGHVIDPDEVDRMGAEFIDQYGRHVPFIVDLRDVLHDVVVVGDQFDILYPPARPEDARPVEVTAKSLQHNLLEIVTVGEQSEIVYFPRRPKAAPPVKMARYGLFAAYTMLISFLLKIILRLCQLIAGANRPGFRDGKYRPKNLIAEFRAQQWLRKYGIRARATVVWHEHSERQDPQERPICPLIEYVDRDGRTRTFLSRPHRVEHLPPIGRQMPVIYEPIPASTHPEATPVAKAPADIPPFAALLCQLLLALILVGVGVLITI